MSASTRILLCRLACIAFCLVPTTIVGGWTCWRATAAFAVAERAEWRRALEQRLGVLATIGAVSYPSPGLCRLEGLVLLDPESRQPLAEADIVEVTASRSGWHVELWQPQVHANELGALAHVIEERLLRSPEESVANCTLAASQLTIHQAGVAQSLVQLAGRFTRQADGPELTCEFKLPDANPAAGPIRLMLSRNRQQSPPATRWQLDTAGQSLPCQWLAEMLPAISRLGRDCRFAGTMSVASSAAAWSGTAAGRLGPLDLDALVSEQFPHQLSGQATLDIEQLAFDRGRLAELRGTLRASHGALSPSLLAAAEQHLQLSAAERVAAATAAIPFQQLAIRLHLDDSELSLAGEADPTQPGVLIAAANGPLLSAPPQHSTPAVNLLRTLLPASEFQVPATRQTSGLVGLLPVPELAPAATASTPAHTPTRLTPADSQRPAVRQPMMR